MQLNNGFSIPQMGAGTWTLRGETARENVRLALEAGFRHIDTAQMYENEAEVGQGIVDSNVPRNEVFLTTKIFPNTMRQGAEAVRRSIEESLVKLKTDYIDLLLIHWPVKDCVKYTWQVMEDYVRQGKVRSIGVSNFNPHHLDDLLAFAEIRPVVNQIDTLAAEYPEYRLQPPVRHSGGGLGTIRTRRHRCLRRSAVAITGTEEREDCFAGCLEMDCSAWIDYHPTLQTPSLCRES